MSKSLSKYLLGTISVWFVLVLFCMPADAQNSAVIRLKEEIQDTKKTVKEQKQELLKLTREERSMFGELAAIEDRITDVERDLFRKEEELEKIIVDENNAKFEHIKLKKELNKIVDKLKGMLTKLWPVHSRKLENRFGSLENWQSADRNFVWLASLYKETKKELEKAQLKADELSQNIQVQKELRDKAEKN